MPESRKVALASCIVALSMLLVPTRASAIAIVAPPALYGGHTYYLLDLANWLDAEGAAVALGGHLATIDDQAENDFVTATFGGSRNLWIGLMRTGPTAQDFAWVSGATLAYTNWASGEPNNYCPSTPCEPEDRVNIYQDYGNDTLGKWNDAPGASRLNGVVETETAVPEPSSLALLSLGIASLVGRARRRR